jgi:hypothetical protein
LRGVDIEIGLLGRKEDDVQKFGVAAAKRPKILGTLIGPVLTAGVIPELPYSRSGAAFSLYPIPPPGNLMAPH